MTITDTRTVIGTIEVPAGTIHDASYECAAWYRTFEYPAQTCEVYYGTTWVSWKLEGTTTHEHFPSLFGGVATGGGTMGDCDKASTYYVSPYNYSAAEMVEAGKITLNDAARVNVSSHDHHDYCMGYTTDYDVAIGSGGDRYPSCSHDVHLDAHHMPTTVRNERGNLVRGYTVSFTTKRHIKIALKGTQ
jgi:hypothetical protein